MQGGSQVQVRKVRNQNKVGKIVLSRSEVESVRRHGLSIEDWIKQMLLIIAKKRRWKWYLKEKSV